MGADESRQGIFCDTSGAATKRKKTGLKIRAKFVCVSLLLCVAVVGTFFTATGTIQAYQRFQQDHQLIQTGDVTTVRAWMTIPYVARVYHVPESCFSQSLHISNHWLEKHATLRDIASYYHWSGDGLIRDVQEIILNYRQGQHACGTPVATPGASKTPGAPGRVTVTPTFALFIWKGRVL